MEQRQVEACAFDRRGAFKAALACAAVGAGAAFLERRATAQTVGDVDLLNLVLNYEYLATQFFCTAAGIGIDSNRLTSNGALGTPPVPGRKVNFTDLQLASIVREIGTDNQNHLNPIRTVIGALAIAQPLMDISANPGAPFSFAMRAAGGVGADVAFDPYLSEENFLYAALFIKGIGVAAYRGLTASVSNRVVTQNFSGLLGAESIHHAAIRSYLYTRGAATQRLRDNSEKIAAYQRSLNAPQVFQGVAPFMRSYVGGTALIRVANVTPAQADGQIGGLTSGRLLNQLYLTSAAATAGGFFPQGVGGNIRTSASA